MKKFLCLLLVLALAAVPTMMSFADVSTPTDVAPVEPVVEPVETPEEPVETPEQPEETPEQPEETPEQPEETPEQPVETPEQPVETPEQPVETPEEPAEKPEEPAKFAKGYATLAAGAKLYADKQMTELYGTVEADAVVYISARHETDNADRDVMTVQLAVNGEPVQAYAYAADVAALAEAPEYTEADAVYREFKLKNAEVRLEAEPVEETPVEEAPVEETPVEETPVDETPVDETTEEPTETPEEPVETPEEPVVTEEITEEAQTVETKPARAALEDWQQAPTVTAVQSDSERVTFTITPVAPADKYSIYEVTESGNTFVLNASSTTPTIKAEVGEHTYKVQPRKTVNGATVKGEWSEPVTVTVAAEDAWKTPAITAEVTGADSVKITITAEEAADKYAVAEYVGGKYVWKRNLTTNLTCTITGVEPGEHIYAVQARKTVDGTLVSASYVRAEAVTIDAPDPWRVPTVTAEQTGAGEVTITIDAEEAAVRYAVAEYVGGKYVWKKNTTTTTVVLTGIEDGEHVFAVQPRKTIDGTLVSASYVNAPAVTVETVDPWRTPTVTAEQTGDGEVTLTIDAEEAADRYAVAEYVGGKYVWKKNTTTTTVVLTDVELGEHIFAVQPRKTIDGTLVSAAYVQAPAITVEAPEYWRTPTVTAEQTGDGEVTLTIDTVEEADKYALAEYTGGKYVWKKTFTGTTYVLTGVKPGEHIFAVQPRKTIDGTLVNAAYVQAPAITVEAVDLWRTPTAVAELTGENEITITITAEEAADRYAIAEVIDGKYVWKKNTTTTTCVLTNVEKGDHVYAVQPRKTIDGTLVSADYVVLEPVSNGVAEIREENGLYIYHPDIEEYEITFTPVLDGTTITAMGATAFTQLEGVVSTSISIPKTILGYPVTYIGEEFLDGNTNVVSVVLPEYLTEIRRAAFRGCTSLATTTVGGEEK